MKLKLLSTIFIVFSSFMLSAQQIVINGTVTDAKDGSLLTGVNVIIKGTTKGSITSIDESFLLIESCLIESILSNRI